MWSNTIRYLSITSSECELYRVISFFNPEKEKNTKKNPKKGEKSQSLKSSHLMITSCKREKLKKEFMRGREKKKEEKGKKKLLKQKSEKNWGCAREWVGRSSNSRSETKSF